MALFDFYKGVWTQLFGPNSISSPTTMNPVVVNSDGSINAGLTGTITVTGTIAATQSGTWNINAITTLPALAAGSAIIGQVGIDQTTPGTTNAVVATGNIASGATDSGNPVKIGGKYNLTPPTFTDGQRGDGQLGARGAIRVELWGPSAAVPVGFQTAADTQNSNNSLNTNGYMSAFNNASWDRFRGNIDTAALSTFAASAAGTTNSADQTNYNGRGVIVGVNLTIVTTATVTVTIQGKDAASGAYYTLLTSTALATAGFTQLTVYPGSAVTANLDASQPLPRTWRVQTVIVGASAAVTGTIGASVIL